MRGETRPPKKAIDTIMTGAALLLPGLLLSGALVWLLRGNSLRAFRAEALLRHPGLWGSVGIALLFVLTVVGLVYVRKGARNACVD